MSLCVFEYLNICFHDIVDTTDDIYDTSKKSQAGIYLTYNIRQHYIGDIRNDI